MFANFQWWEIMRCMVKLNDLEELAEPPLGGTPDASTLKLPKEAAMDLDEAGGLQAEANVVAYFSPGETNIGLL